MLQFRRFKVMLFGIFVFLNGMLFCSMTVQAYIDPSVVSYALQALSGIIVSISTLSGVLITKLSNKTEGITHYETYETDDIHMWDEACTRNEK